MSQVAKGEGLCAEGTSSATERNGLDVLTPLQVPTRSRRLSLSTRPSRCTRSPRTSSRYTTRPCPRRCWRSWRRWSPWTPVSSWVALSPARAAPTATASSKRPTVQDHLVESKTVWTPALAWKSLGSPRNIPLALTISLTSTLFLRFQSSLFPASALHYSLFFVCTLVYVLGLGLDRVASGALVFLGANDLFFRFPGFCISHYGQEEIEGNIQAVF